MEKNSSTGPKFTDGVDYVFNKNKMQRPTEFDWSDIIHGYIVIPVSPEVGYVMHKDTDGRETKYNVIPRWCSIKTY